jgi:hypothetical protein
MITSIPNYKTWLTSLVSRKLPSSGNLSPKPTLKGLTKSVNDLRLSQDALTARLDSLTASVDRLNDSQQDQLEALQQILNKLWNYQT